MRAARWAQLVGFVLAHVTEITIFSLFELAVSVADNVLISAIFTAISIVRSFHGAKIV
jgi:hypothetical protein